MRAPTVKRGQPLTAGLWNELAGVVNGALAAPRDLDAGVLDGEIGQVIERELARTTDTVRVTSPDDEDVYVDVARITSVTVRDTRTGLTTTTHFESS